MTNEDVIDLYDRVKLGAPVVVLAPGNRASHWAWTAYDCCPRHQSHCYNDIGIPCRLREFENKKARD